MDKALSAGWTMADHEERITEAIGREQGRLRSFIRRRVADEADAEDILQDVFFEFIEAYRLMKPIEQAGAWLFRVARNRIIDRFRKKKPVAFSGLNTTESEGGDSLSLEELLPSPDAGPEALYARSILLEELDAALDELPEDQREVFVAHEFEGVSFKELSASTGVGINNLLSRKHRAVLYLRRRLRNIYEEFQS
ncbi:MAG TPA: RNA polymerase sigma factor [Candidatus Acidoferrales bacterium]|nr:RNA polymerase sigma factor [Candidatus Acidoferrales bacterium]